MAAPAVEDGKIVIEINLGDLWMDEGSSFREGKTVTTYIAELAAQRLLDRETEVRAELQSRVRAITDDQISVAAEEAVRTAMATVLQPTDEFDNPTGPAMPLTKHIIETVRRELKLTDGKRMGTGQHAGVLERIVAHEVERVLVKELQQEFAEAKTRLREVMREKASEVLAEAMERAASSAR